MFTDDQTTPVRLEILIDLLRGSPRGIPRESVNRLLQPEPLSGEKTGAARATIRAALDLEVATEQGDTLKLSEAAKKVDTRSAVLKAIDRRVLSTTEVELYFALFFSYHLGMDKAAQSARRDGPAWVKGFNQTVFRGEEQTNAFNPTKLSGLHRWFGYAGLGWYDPGSTQEFQPNPYERLRRALPRIFGKSKKLTSEDWMTRLGEQCPELDGGLLFRQANPRYSAESKKCSLGLSHALVELDLDGVIHLSRPADSAGWSIEDAEPPIESASDKKGTRLSFVELLAKS